MYAQLQDLMQWRMSLLFSGRHRDLAKEYLYPLPVYLAGRQHVLRTPEDMERSLRRLSQISESMGIARMEVSVRAIELPRQGRFRVWVSYRHLDRKEVAQGGGSYVLYCRQTPEGVKTEMADYPDCRSDWVQQEPKRVTA